MKFKLCLLIFMLSVIFSIQNAEIAHAENNTQWCRITTENTILYKTIPTSENDSCYFTLPTTYFAKVLDCADKYSKISFQDIEGYVLTENITFVYSEPLTPFPENITFQINNSLDAVIKDNPSVNGKYVGTLKNGQTATFFGKILGEEAIAGLGTTWYYMSFDYNGQKLFGYVYAPLTENLTPIKENTEEVLLTPVSTQPSKIVVSPELLDYKNILIIISLCVVGTLLILAIFIPQKKKHNSQRRVLKQKFDDLDF